LPTLKLRKDEAIVFTGPAMVTVVNGVIEIYNKRFSVNDKIIIHRFRNYVIHALEDTELDINMGEGSQIQNVDESEPYFERLKLAEEIITSSKHRKIMVIGGVDTGKSSISILLSNTAINHGFKPAVIDLDVGQADIGPPCFISMAYPSEQVIWMRELKPVIMKFIGDIKPQYVYDAIIHNAMELIDKSIEDGRNPIIIDTDGWIGDEYALNYKYKLIYELKPDALIIIGEENYTYYRVFEKMNIAVYRTRIPVYRRVRNRDERRVLRRDKYSEYLVNTSERRISLDEVVVMNNPLLQGQPITLQGDIRSIIQYASRINDTLYIVPARQLNSEMLSVIKESFNVSRIKIYPHDFEKNLYIAVSDGLRDYPGVVTRIDYENRVIYVKTRFDGVVNMVKFSNIRLLEDYSESLIEVKTYA